MNKAEVVVVGAGPAGLSCACALARKGVDVVVIERGSFPGSKNMFGGIFFTPVMEKLFPDFFEQAPWERFVARRRISLLSGDSEAALDFRPGRFSRPPYNHSLIVKRADIDQWFAKKAEAAGANIICDYCVRDFIREGKRIVGVAGGGEEDRLLADVVVCAEGANSLLTEKAGIREPLGPACRSIAVKENIRLTREVIELRFGLSGRQGAAYEFFGAASQGLLGSGFIYTNRDSLSVGVGFSIQDYIDRGKGRAPNDILEDFKGHPAVAPLLDGGEVAEYLCHMIPCDDFRRTPKLYRDGLLVVGDAAGFVNNSFLHEGVNLAMTSGVLAAETILAAREKGDFSERALSVYQKRLAQSCVMKDLKEAKNFIPFVRSHPQLLREYPAFLNDILAEYFEISDQSKGEMKKHIFKKIRQEIGMGRLAADTLGILKNLV